MELRSPERHSKLLDDDNEFDDDDLMIVYKEQAVPDPLSMSQPSGTQTNTQTEVTSSPVNHSGMIIPRHERRKRRHEWRERQLVEQQQQQRNDDDDTSPSPEDDEEPSMEDAFASLQSLLREHPTSGSSSQAQTVVVTNNKENNQPHKPQEPERVEEEQQDSHRETGVEQKHHHHQQHRQQHQQQQQPSPAQNDLAVVEAANGLLESSPPDFGVYDDYEEVETTTSDEPHRASPAAKESIRLQHQHSSNSSIPVPTTTSSSRQTKKRRKENMKRIRDRLPSQKTLPGPEFETPPSPVRKIPKKRRASSVSSRPSWSNPQRDFSATTQSQQQQQANTQVQDGKSIVGSRYVYPFGIHYLQLKNYSNHTVLCSISDPCTGIETVLPSHEWQRLPSCNNGDNDWPRQLHWLQPHECLLVIVVVVGKSPPDE
jgi:hypothetical protein